MLLRTHSQKNGFERVHTDIRWRVGFHLSEVVWRLAKNPLFAYIPQDANVATGGFRRKADVRSTTVQTPYLAGKGSGRAEDEGLVEGGRAEGAAGSGTEWRMGERAGDGAADGIRL